MSESEQDFFEMANSITGKNYESATVIGPRDLITIFDQWKERNKPIEERNKPIEEGVLKVYTNQIIQNLTSQTQPYSEVLVASLIGISINLGLKYDELFQALFNMFKNPNFFSKDHLFNILFGLALLNTPKNEFSLIMSVLYL
ncbi:hypothetical protein LCGC14_2203820 [marine sediment metagenome]|uniref:Uncharacterized protein n=1 Tax=marine sediment metagenome TaxID=412755 RepID=A0A0F9DFU8_9ZZZZ